MRLVSTRRLLGILLFAASGLVLGGCGSASAWTTLHPKHLPGGRQYVVQGGRDGNGYCFYDLSWLPPGTMEQDIARDDSTCHLVAEVAPTLPEKSGTIPLHNRTHRIP